MKKNHSGDYQRRIFMCLKNKNTILLPHELQSKLFAYAAYCSE